MISAADDLLDKTGKTKFGTVLADPPWQFQNRTGKMAPEHKRLNRTTSPNASSALSFQCQVPSNAAPQTAGRDRS